MKKGWKEIVFKFVDFFLNPIEKYRIFIIIWATIIEVIAYINKNSFTLFISQIILILLNPVLKKYKEYKLNYKFIKKSPEIWYIKDVSFFPSGNILVSTFNSIKIYDINFNVLQNISNNLKKNFVSIKNENNFLVYANNNILFYESFFDQNYSLHGKINNLFDLQSAFFFDKNYLLCFSNNEIKIFEKKFPFDYEMVLSIKGNVKSTLFLEKEKILIYQAKMELI